MGSKQSPHPWDRSRTPSPSHRAAEREESGPRGEPASAERPSVHRDSLSLDETDAVAAVLLSEQKSPSPRPLLSSAPSAAGDAQSAAGDVPALNPELQARVARAVAAIVPDSRSSDGESAAPSRRSSVLAELMPYELHVDIEAAFRVDTVHEHALYEVQTRTNLPQYLVGGGEPEGDPHSQFVFGKKGTTAPVRTFRARRRFKDFRALFGSLSTAAPFAILPFPLKQFLDEVDARVGLDRMEEGVELRRRKLQRFLRAVVANPLTSSAPETVSFLTGEARPSISPALRCPGIDLLSQSVEGRRRPSALGLPSPVFGATIAPAPKAPLAAAAGAADVAGVPALATEAQRRLAVAEERPGEECAPPRPFSPPLSSSSLGATRGPGRFEYKKLVEHIGRLHAAASGLRRAYRTLHVREKEVDLTDRAAVERAWSELAEASGKGDGAPEYVQGAIRDVGRTLAAERALRTAQMREEEAWFLDSLEEMMEYAEAVRRVELQRELLLVRVDEEEPELRRARAELERVQKTGFSGPVDRLGARLGQLLAGRSEERRRHALEQRIEEKEAALEEKVAQLARDKDTYKTFAEKMLEGVDARRAAERCEEWRLATQFAGSRLAAAERAAALWREALRQAEARRPLEALFAPDARTCAPED
eukprot:tig00000949_g5713.t1